MDPHQVSLEEMISTLGWETLARVLWVSGEEEKMRPRLRTITQADVSCTSCNLNAIIANKRKIPAEAFYCTKCGTASNAVDLVMDLPKPNFQTHKASITQKVTTYFKAELDEVALHDV